MIKPTRPTDKLLFTTVRIEITKHSGERGAGTGFFFNYSLDSNKTLPLIITNRHVVEGAVKGRFQLHESQSLEDKKYPSGNYFTIELDSFEEMWIGHPDSTVDLCVMPFQPLRIAASQLGKEIYNIALDESLVFNDEQLLELTAVEEILMVGYPIGIWDSTNNLPLLRRGSTATHPALKFCGKSVFMIDAACFPGSSGSPVLLANLGPYSDNDGSLVLGSRFALLGVLHAGPHMNAEGQIIPKPIPTHFVPVSETKIMIHLGYVIRASEILCAAKHAEENLKANGRL